MNKEKAQEHLENSLTQDDVLIGFFYAVQPFKIWLFFLIGPLAVLSMKHHFVGVSEKGMYFHRLNLLGKFTDHDFFKYDEIESLKIGKGMLQRPMRLKFKNGRDLELKAQLKGVDKVAKLNEATQKHMEKNIATIK
jgi:hypothetical protein